MPIQRAEANKLRDTDISIALAIAIYYLIDKNVLMGLGYGTICMELTTICSIIAPS